MPSIHSFRAPGSRRVSGVARIAAVNLAVLLVLIMAAELIFGGWLSGPRYGALTLPRNVVRYFDTAGLYDGGKAVRYSRDRHGLRGSYGDPSTIGILTIGGSTTNQLYIDDSETWQARLQDRFAAAGHAVTVANAGVDGQSTRGHLALFDHWLTRIPNLRPRFVLAYVGINDEALRDAETFDTLEPDDPLRRMRAWLANKSALYGLYRTISGMIAAYDMHLVHGQSAFRGLAWARYAPAAQRVETEPGREADIATYQDRLRRLAEKIRALGAEPIFVSQPTAEFRIEDGWVLVPVRNGAPRPGDYRTIAQFNQATMETCRALAALCLDLARDVAFGEDDFYDRVHNTPQGARKIADYLFSRLGEIAGR